MDGILVIRKEKGYTSHDVVAKLRGILHMKKIGHTGTLDPAAEGVLPVALGKGTRLVELLTEKEITYEAVLRLGVSTDTQDMTGAVLSEKPVTVTEEEVREAVGSFVGEQQQVPPMYSALKVNGKKLYELAREGKTIERKPRPVVFYEIRILDMELPLVRISVTCSKGTYIRTLCNDIGEKLGCGGAMEELLRTRSGNFTLEESMTLSQVEEAVADGTIGEKLVSIEDVVVILIGYCAQIVGCCLKLWVAHTVSDEHENIFGLFAGCCRSGCGNLSFVADCIGKSFLRSCCGNTADEQGACQGSCQNF